MPTTSFPMKMGMTTTATTRRRTTKPTRPRTPPRKRSDMSATRAKLEQDLKDAMRARNELARDTLRLVLSDVKKAEVDHNRDATEEDVVAALTGGAKRRQESIDQFERA